MGFMSHSTTSTCTHILAKYSKSYPSSNNSQTVANGLSDPGSEWQHFVNPLMRLVLDVKKSSNNELESVRLRVLWSMNDGADAMDVDQREVVFEDLDLLSFSSSVGSYRPPQNRYSHGLPLKAVYRDTVVGIRYLHPRIIPPGTAAAYRRFQITFQNLATASQFIDSISNVCPCKANPAPPPTPSAALHMTTRQNATSHNTIPGPSNRNSSFAIAIDSPYQGLTVNPSFPAVTNSRSTTAATLPSHSLIGNLPSSSPSPMLSSSPVMASSTLTNNNARSARPILPPFSASGSLLAGQPPGSAITSDVSYQQNIITPISETALYQSTSNLRMHDTSLLNTSPSSSPFNSSNDSMKPHLPLPSSSANIQATTNATIEAPDGKASDPFIAALRQQTTLYDLSAADLEELVGDVIQEDGFTKLLETLDSMWRIKGLVTS